MKKSAPFSIRLVVVAVVLMCALSPPLSSSAELFHDREYKNVIGIIYVPWVP